MAISFTPQFFTQPVASGMKPATTAVSSSGHKSTTQKKYSTKHGIPRRQSPWSNVATLRTEHERYSDIDWNKKEIITQDGAHVKFGAALGDAGETTEEEFKKAA